MVEIDIKHPVYSTLKHAEAWLVEEIEQRFKDGEPLDRTYLIRVIKEVFGFERQVAMTLDSGLHFDPGEDI